ncbi:MAG: cupin domain-containing protein, partial [Candidatus Fimimonas sp.]
EFGYVLCGKVEIVTLHERYKLSAGDSFSIDGKKQHKIVNAQKGESKILWITTPSNF